MQAGMAQLVGGLSPAGKKVSPALQCSDVMLRHG
jgi:hypothetical protein